MTKEERSAYNKAYREANKDKKKITQKAYYEANKDRLSEMNRKNREDKKDEIKAYNKAYREANKERLREYYKQRRLNDSLFALKTRIKNLVKKSFTDRGKKKNTKTELILGCSYNDFKLYVESKFEPWMTWENRGKYNGTENYGWDIDHRIPLDTAETEEDIIRLNHYTNLQPLCSYVNRDVKKNLIIY